MSRQERRSCDGARRAWPARLEALEPRVLLSGVGDIDPNTIRIGQSIDAAPNGDLAVAVLRASGTVEIARRGADGSLAWSRTLRPGSASGQHVSLALCEDGGLLVAGTFTGTRDFDPGAGEARLTATRGHRGLFLLQLDAQGQFVWARRVTGHAGLRLAAVEERAGDAWVAGSFTGGLDLDLPTGPTLRKSAGRRDAALFRFGPEGDLRWAATWGGRGDDDARDLAVDASGQAWVAGSFSRSIDLDPGPRAWTLSSAGGSDGLVAHLGGDGGLLWAGSLGGRGSDGLSHIAAAADGGVWLGGWFSRQADLDPTAGESLHTSAGGRDVGLIRLDPSHGFAWAGSLPARGSQYLAALAAAPDGGLLAAGPVVTGLDLDPGVGRRDAGGRSGLFLLRLAPDATLAWAGRIGGGRAESAWGVHADAAGVVLLGNYLSDATDFDPGPGEARLPDRPGVFVAWYDPDGEFKRVERV